MSRYSFPMFLLQLRNELWKLFGKKRTYIGFGMLLAAQLIIVLVFRYSRASGDGDGALAEAAVAAGAPAGFMRAR